MSLVRGVDGCPAGWLGVTLDPDLGTITPRVFADATDLLGDDAAGVTAIDIPIGLPRGGARACDLEARKLIGPRASSVFPAPVRAALASSSYEEACVLSHGACGRKMSKQAFAILPKIRDVDAVLRRRPALLESVFEVHPEVSFCVMNGHMPMEHPKRSGFGFAGRLRLLEGHFPGAADRIRGAVARREAGDDDILDALAVLWTACRIFRGAAMRLPGAREERDEHDLPMQMLA